MFFYALSTHNALHSLTTRTVTGLSLEELTFTLNALLPTGIEKLHEDELARRIHRLNDVLAVRINPKTVALITLYEI